MASLATFLLLSNFAVSSATESEKLCAMRRFGKLKQFVGGPVGNNVELPCRYILAEFTKTVYKVTVTANNNLDPGTIHRFSPDKLTVDILDMSTGFRWTGQTRRDKLAVKPIGKPNIWRIRESTLIPDEVTLTTDREAKVKLNGVFELTFSDPSDDKGIEITVVEPVTSTPYPRTLCGSTDVRFAFEHRRFTLFGNSNPTTRSMVYTYDVLDNAHVGQPNTCNNIRNKFRSCDPSRKGDAIRICSNIFSLRGTSKCLIDASDPENDFCNCLRAVCDQDATFCQAVNDELCPGLNPIDCNPA